MMMMIPIYRFFDRDSITPPHPVYTDFARYLVCLDGQDRPPAPEEVLASFEQWQDARERMLALSREAFEQHVRGRLFDRYITNWHVAVNEPDARKWQQHDHNRWDEVEITRGLEIVHADPVFAVWSDERVTGAIYHIPPGGPLSPDAVALLRLVSEAGWSTVEGGPGILARVAHITGRETIDPGTASRPHERERFEQLTVAWNDGSTSSLFTHLEAQFEDYTYTVYQTLDSLQQAIRPADPENFPSKNFPS